MVTIKTILEIIGLIAIVICLPWAITKYPNLGILPKFKSAVHLFMLKRKTT